MLLKCNQTSIFHNKYWPETSVTFLGYDKFPTFELPQNFKFVSLGKQEDFGITWADALLPFFKNIKDKYFVLFPGDFMPAKVVDQTKFDLIYQRLKECGGVKAALDHTTVKKKYLYSYQNHCYIQRKLNLVLYPFIIQREYFIKYCVAGRTAREFESLGNIEADRNQDGIMLIPDGFIVDFVHMIDDGQLRWQYFVAKIKNDEDWSLLEQYLPAKDMEIINSHGGRNADIKMNIS